MGVLNTGSVDANPSHSAVKNSIQYPVSDSIHYPISSDKYPESSIQYLEPSIHFQSESSM